jgi:hypothetical protein
MGVKQGRSYWERKKRTKVFGKRVLKRIFDPRREEAIRKWKKLHNDELNNMYSSPHIIRVIKSRIMRWASM